MLRCLADKARGRKYCAVLPILATLKRQTSATMRYFLAYVILTGLMLSLHCQKNRKKDRALREMLRKFVNQRTSSVGPVKVEVLSSGYDQNLQIRCVANVTYAVRFAWWFQNQTLFENEKVKIESAAQHSQLTIRKAKKIDSGTYKCVARFNQSRSAPFVFVDLKPPLKIKIRPKDVVVESGEHVEWHCDNAEGNLTNASYSWARKLLPRGRWRTLAVNNERYEWRTPRRLHAKEDDFDVYDVYCEITYQGVTVRSPVARLVVARAGTAAKLGSCPAELVEGIQWEQTLLGMVDAQLCLADDEDSGTAKRVCEAFPGRPPKWRPPNLNDCSSPKFASLQDEFDALEEGFKVNLDVPQALEQLRTLTRVDQRPRPGTAGPARLFGRDLLSTVHILRRTRDFFKKERRSKTSAKETFSSYTETASNVLDLENEETWREIETDNPETPSDLVTSLDNFGFDLEEDFLRDGDVIQERVEKNLAFQMRRIDVNSKLRNSDVVFQQNKSRILLPQTIFSEVPTEAVVVVSVVYDTLASILGEVNTTITGNLSSHLAPNSRIISSTVKPLGEGEFKQPVRIFLENNGTFYNESAQRRCVFWQPEVANSRWSDEGCRLVPDETTSDITTCECDHLTLFAVMVESGGDDTDSEELERLEVISTVGSAISLAAVLLTMMIYSCFWRVLWSPRFVNFMNLCFAIALLDIFSVLRGPFKEDEGPCTTIGILLHFFVLAVFMWMLCEGLLLCLLLTDVFKKNYGRKWYMFVHLIGWGLPALIVAISIGSRGASSYGLSGHCWLTRSNGFIWAAMAPMIVVLVASYVVYGVMLHRVITSHKVQQEDTLGKVKATARASIIIMPILGFTWTFAILDFFFDLLTFKYLFAIFNSLQGLFIFIFHCLMNQQVQQAMFSKKKPERRSILDRVKTQEMRMTASQDSLESIR